MFDNMGVVEQIWFKDPVRFVTDTQSMLSFIPHGSQSLEEQLNSAVRFSVYFGVLVAVLRNDPRALFFPVFVALFTIFVYNYELDKRQTKADILEKLNLDYDERKKQVCMLPSKENPFMNVLVSEYTDFPNRPPACNVANRSVRKTINHYATNGVPQDIDNLYGAKASQLNFHTMPSTSIPNDQTTFAHWLYRPNATKKEAGVLSFDWRK